MSTKFTVSAKPTTPASRKATADDIEAFIGAVMNGKAKPKDLDVSLLTGAVQGLRDAAHTPNRPAPATEVQITHTTPTADNAGTVMFALADSLRSIANEFPAALDAQALDALDAVLASRDGQAQAAAVPSAGVSMLRNVIETLRATGSYSDEEGEATNHLATLLDTLAVAAEPSIEMARRIGETGVKHSEKERQLFIAYMQGHCWKAGPWDAERSEYLDMHTRVLYAVWRARGALAAQAAAVPEPCEICKKPVDGHSGRWCCRCLGVPTPIADTDVWPIVRVEVTNGKITSATQYAPGLPDGEHDVYPVRCIAAKP